MKNVLKSQTDKPDKRGIWRGIAWMSLLLALAAALCGLLWAESAKQTVPPGVTLSGWAIGGLPYRELEAGLAARLEAVGAGEVSIAGAVNGQELPGRGFTLRELGFVHDGDAVLKQLLEAAQGRPLRRVRNRWKLRNKVLEIRVGFDPVRLEEALDGGWPGRLPVAPVNAARWVDGQDRVGYDIEKPGYRADIGEVGRQLLTGLAAGAPLLARPEAPPPVRLELPLRTVQPDVTVESLQAEGIREKVSQFATVYNTAQAGRSHNIEAVARTIHGMILKPGEDFDFAQVIKKAEEQYGFREAPVILNGVLVPGIGGGICQVSSTLYNAALRAGLQIVERRNHSLPLSYVPLGLDATYADGYINFKFRNNTDHDLLIRTHAADGRISVKLFGTGEEGIVYEVRSRIVKSLPPPKKYVHNPALPKGVEKPLSSGKTGYVVESYRIKKRDGVVVDEELLFRDTYRPQPMLVAVNSPEPAGGGTGTGPGPDGSPGGNPGQGQGGAQENNGLPEDQGFPFVIEDGVLGPRFR